MTYSLACTRCARLGGTALLTAALATSLLTLPPGRTSRMPLESHLVLLQAATASALTNSSALDAASSTDSPADLSANGIQANSTAAVSAQSAASAWSAASTADTASTEVAPTPPTPSATIATAAIQSNSTAAATGDFADTLTTLGRTVATVAGWALAPIWYLAFPITTTLWDVAISQLFPNYPKLLGIPFFAQFPTSWFVPFLLPSILFPTVTSPTAASLPAAARSAAKIDNTIDEPAATTDATATQPLRRGQALRDNSSRRANSNPAAANSKRSASSAAAIQSPVRSKAFQGSRSAASKSRSASDAG